MAKYAISWNCIAFGLTIHAELHHREVGLRIKIKEWV